MWHRSILLRCALVCCIPQLRSVYKKTTYEAVAIEEEVNL
jgi:hypothetical protein